MNNSENIFIFRKSIDLSFIDVKPGEWVVIKPNLVKESKENDPTEWQSVITSPHLIGLVCQDVCKKLQGKGRITICDSPQSDSSFAGIAGRLALNPILEQCRKDGVMAELVDLRNAEWISEGGIITERRKLKGDPNGVIRFNLGHYSTFYGFRGEGHYYGADYTDEVVNNHHYGDVQEYLLCATPILADVFINIAKLKTHKKTGVTLSLKNLVGINADKNWLPHYSKGAPETGGDEFPCLGLKESFEQRAVHLARKIALRFPKIGPKLSQGLRVAGTATFGHGDHVIRSGNWYGNNTTWRMVLDLNRCLLYGNHDGTLRCDSPKRYFCLIDGLIGMEGSGPMQGTPVNSNVVIGGTDPVMVDLVAARVMGFDWRKIPVIREAFSIKSFPITNSRVEDVKVVSDVAKWNGPFLNINNREFFRFKPHFGWVGHIEYE